MAGDFEDALSHLRVLRKHWPSKLNVARYLAATHYRMGNNSDAIRELEKSLEAWPDEVPIRQQLARALEAAGLHAAATRAWQEILSRQPNHPFAREALQHLSDQSSAAPVQAAAVPETGRRCPSCDAENGDEFERCWQCHATLATDEQSSSTEPPSGTPFQPTASLIDLQDHVPVTIASIVVALIGAGISAYFFEDAWTMRNTPAAEISGGASVYAVLATGLFSLRITLAVVLAIFCPIALYGASFAVRIPMPTVGTIIAVGLACASLAVAVTWLPVSALVFAPFIFAAGTFPLILWLFSPRFVRGAAIAAIQCTAAIALVVGTAFQVEGRSFVEELPTIIEYGAEHDGQTHGGRHELSPIPTPAEYTLEFASTGSPWLNEHGAAVRIEATTNNPDQKMDVELFEYEESLTFYYGDPAVVPFEAELGRPYRLTLGGKEIPSTTRGTIVGILPLQIHSDVE